MVKPCNWFLSQEEIFIDCRSVVFLVETREERDPHDPSATNHWQLYDEQPLRLSWLRRSWMSVMRQNIAGVSRDTGREGLDTEITSGCPSIQWQAKKYLIHVMYTQGDKSPPRDQLQSEFHVLRMITFFGQAQTNTNTHFFHLYQPHWSPNLYLNLILKITIRLKPTFKSKN